MRASLGQRLFSPIAEVRRDEVLTALLMFLYSFLAMTSYNIVKPITRSKFISALGADNLPYVLLAVGLLIGVVMTAYSWTTSRLPRRWGLPATQGAMVGVLLVFWVLFQTPAAWVSAAFFVAGKILGLLLISQFWTLANLVYDPRQAKRLFGLIAGGAPLGGIAGSALLTVYAEQIGTTNLLLYSAAVLTLCLAVVIVIIAREQPAEMAAASEPARDGMGAAEAFRMLRESRHLRIIAMVVSVAAIGASIVEQQLNMAVAAAKGQEATDAITGFLGQVQLVMSVIGFVIQVWLTSRIHRLLGIGFALLVLPVALGSTALLMLLNAALWVPGLARVTNQSLRYTVDKTTREILFLPLPAEVRYEAKSFVDVTVDRVAQGVAAVLLLILIKPWGLGLDWQRLGLASLAIMVLWVALAILARRGYLDAFRHSIDAQHLQPAEVRLSVVDLSTVETLMAELASPDARRVLYAIDVLESLQKRNLVTPLLLHHGAAAVRARALAAIGATPRHVARQWVPVIRRLLADEDSDVRTAALMALAQILDRDAVELMRPYLDHDDPRLATTAATVIARTGHADDMVLAGQTFGRLASDGREAAIPGRREVASALRSVQDRTLRQRLVPLLHDPSPAVAATALRSVAALGSADFLFVPALVSLLRHRELESVARDVLVGYGEPVLDALAHVLDEPSENTWVTRRLPATIARIPCRRSVEILIGALSHPDGFVRFEALAALGRLRRDGEPLELPAEAVEARTLREAATYYTALGLHHNLFVRANVSSDTLLARALEEKAERGKDRIYRLLGLIHPWKDIATARWALEHGDARASAAATELLDNTLTGRIRTRIMPILEDVPLDDRVTRGHVFLETRSRDVEESLVQLVHDDDQIIAAAAINLVRTQHIEGLADDLEYVLAHRDTKDWHVLEAASLALAGQCMPEERRRRRWLEPLPAIDLADRLRSLALFDAVSVDALVRIAETGTQVRHEAGRTIYTEGEVPDRLEFLLDGRVTTRSGGGEPTIIDPPAPLAFVDVLGGRPMANTIVTVDRCVSLALSTEACRTLLADNPDLLRGLFRMLGDTVDAEARLVHRSNQHADRRADARRGGQPDDLGRPATDRLAPIATLLTLQRIEPFARLSSDELWHVAAIVRDVPMVADARLFGPSDPTSIWVIVTGAVSLESSSLPPASARAGDAVGVFHTLAGLPLDRDAHVIRPGRALRLDGDDLFDLLGQRSDLRQQLFGAMFAERPSAVCPQRPSA